MSWKVLSSARVLTTIFDKNFGVIQKIKQFLTSLFTNNRILISKVRSLIPLKTGPAANPVPLPAGRGSPSLSRFNTPTGGSMSWKKETGISLKGQFLIAMPSLLDPNFFQTVTCVCEHTLEGALGLVINRVLPELTGTMIFQELGLDPVPKLNTIPVYLGGPVHKGQIFVLHGPPFEWEGLHLITPSLALSNSKDILDALARGKGPGSYIIALGCAGWGPGQLESEIMNNAWLTSPVNEVVLFETQAENRWEQSAKLLGIDISLLGDTVGHA